MKTRLSKVIYVVSLIQSIWVIKVILSSCHHYFQTLTLTNHQRTDNNNIRTNIIFESNPKPQSLLVKLAMKKTLWHLVWSCMQRRGHSFLTIQNLILHFSDCWHNSLLVGHCGPAPSSRVQCNNININMSQLGHCRYIALLYRNLGSKRMIIW